MLDPETLYTLDDAVLARVQRRQPVLVHLLEGFVDAGQVTHRTSQHLRDACSPTELMRFDHDQLHDYRSRRPQMVFDTNQWVGLTDFRLALDVATDERGEPFLLLTGPEPDTQWERMAAAVLGLAERLNVRQMVTVSGVPMGVPHTRPVLLTHHATDPDLAPSNPVWIDRVHIPGSFAGMLEYRAGHRDLLARGFVAHVPHYLAQGVFDPAVLAVLRKVNETTGLHLPLEAIEQSGSNALASLESEVNEDAELVALVGALEQQYDELEQKGAAAVPSPDEIGAAVERFLAEQDRPDEA